MTLINTDSDATVLVVDDDAATRRSVARLVRSAGFEVKTFASPEAFLRFELPAGPTCVLLDMCMEGMTGLEVQDALRRSGRRVPVIFLSGRSTISTAVAGVRDGAQDFLEKPFRPGELIEALTRALEHDRTQGAERATRADFQRRFDSLTTREQEVIDGAGGVGPSKQTDRRGTGDHRKDR
jgi:FixJ family two-component response regulator